MEKFSKRRKIHFLSLLLLMVVTSFAEVVSIGAVLPFLGIISAPEIAMENNFSNLSDFFR